MAAEPSSSQSSRWTLRVATWNVHEWANGIHEDTLDGIGNLLVASDLDVIGLQEASGEGLKALVARLNNNENTGQPYRLANKFGGTAILTRLPVVAAGRVGQGRRRFCHASVVLPSESSSDRGHVLQMMVAHLDHQKEPLRLKQVRATLHVLQQSSELPNEMHLWMGDMNALTKEDYSKSEWKHICETRARNCWESPVTDLTTFMMTCRKGLVLQDVYSSVPEACRTGPKSTCRYGTRIDYIYVDAVPLKDMGWSMVACEHVDTKKLSDHNLVIATLEQW